MSEKKEYVRFKDGETVTGTVSHNWDRYMKHWVDKTPSRCEGPGCPLCKKKNKAKPTFVAEMKVKTEVGHLPKTLECGKMIYEQVWALQGGSSPVDVDIRRERTGDQPWDVEYVVTKVEVEDDIPF